MGDEASWLVTVENRARRRDWVAVHAMCPSVRDHYDVEFMLGEVLRWGAPSDCQAQSLIQWIVGTWCPGHTWPVQSHCITFHGYVRNRAVIDGILLHNDALLFPRVVPVGMWNIPAFFVDACSDAVDVDAVHSALQGVSSWGKLSMQDVAFRALQCIMQPRREWFGDDSRRRHWPFGELIRRLWFHDLHRGEVLDETRQRALWQWQRAYQSRRSRAHTDMAQSWALILGASKRTRDSVPDSAPDDDDDDDDCRMGMATLQIDEDATSAPQRIRVSSC